MFADRTDRTAEFRATAPGPMIQALRDHHGVFPVDAVFYHKTTEEEKLRLGSDPASIEWWYYMSARTGDLAYVYRLVFSQTVPRRFPARVLYEGVYAFHQDPIRIALSYNPQPVAQVSNLCYCSECSHERNRCVEGCIYCLAEERARNRPDYDYDDDDYHYDDDDDF